MRSEKTTNKDWRTGSGELFGLYIEVGEVKLSSLKAENCRFVECWISSYFHKNCEREECLNPKRRPIYGVIEYIENLCANENTCVLIMEDDNENAVKSWGTAVYLLVKYLKRIENIKAVMLFTKQTREEINTPRSPSFCADFEFDSGNSLYKLADVCFTERSNVFDDSGKGEIMVNAPDCQKYVQIILNK